MLARRAMDSSSQANASFFSLPLEIRNQIYHHAFLNTSYKSTAPPKFKGIFDSAFKFMNQKPALPPLCFASHTTLDEALNVLSDSLTMNILYLYFYDGLPPMDGLRGMRMIDEAWLDGCRAEHQDDTVRRRHSQLLEERLNRYSDFLNGELPYDIFEKIRPVDPKPHKVAVCLSISFQPVRQKIFHNMGCVTVQGYQNLNILEETVITVNPLSRELKDLHSVFELAKTMQMAGYPGIHWLDEAVKRDERLDSTPRNEDRDGIQEEQKSRIIYFD